MIVTYSKANEQNKKDKRDDPNTTGGSVHLYIIQRTAYTTALIISKTFYF